MSSFSVRPPDAFSAQVGVGGASASSGHVSLALGVRDTKQVGSPTSGLGPLPPAWAPEKTEEEAGQLPEKRT